MMNLYKARDYDEGGEFLLGYLHDISHNHVVKVKNADRLALEQEPTIHEIFDAIMTMKSGKCPGIDGLPVEFYRTFWPQLKQVLIDLYRKIFADKKFHLSARQSVITLLGKPNRDLSLLNNWRPLSMLNVDYKIWDKLIANRLTTVLPYIIQDCQTGFMKGRNISENLTQLMSIIEHCDYTQSESILISYDFFKAFDVVSYSSLYQILEFFNFGPYFIEMV